MIAQLGCDVLASGCLQSRLEALPDFNANSIATVALFLHFGTCYMVDPSVEEKMLFVIYGE